jgi:hypothetical protein
MLQCLAGNRREAKGLVCMPGTSYVRCWPRQLIKIFWSGVNPGPTAWDCVGGTDQGLSSRPVHAEFGVYLRHAGQPFTRCFQRGVGVGCPDPVQRVRVSLSRLQNLPHSFSTTSPSIAMFMLEAATTPLPIEHRGTRGPAGQARPSSAELGQALGVCCSSSLASACRDVGQWDNRAANGWGLFQNPTGNRPSAKAEPR